MNLFASLKGKNSLYQSRRLEPGPSLIFLMRSTLVHVQSRLGIFDCFIFFIIDNFFIITCIDTKQMFVFHCMKCMRNYAHSHWLVGISR